MHSGNYDIFYSLLQTNPLTTELSSIKINETSFFPTLRIDVLSDISEHDVYNKNRKFDLEKLKNYFEMNIVIR